MAEGTTRAEGRGSALLWFGLLGAPAAWTVQVVVAPDLAEILCYPATGEGRGEVYGIGIEPFLVALTAALTTVALLALAAAFACWRRTRDGGRAEWMAFGGMLVSGLFGAAIVIGFVPMAMLESCVV